MLAKLTMRTNMQRGICICIQWKNDQIIPNVKQRVFCFVLSSSMACLAQCANGHGFGSIRSSMPLLNRRETKHWPEDRTQTWPDNVHVLKEKKERCGFSVSIWSSGASKLLESGWNFPKSLPNFCPINFNRTVISTFATLGASLTFYHILSHACFC